MMRRSFVIAALCSTVAMGSAAAAVETARMPLDFVPNVGQFGDAQRFVGFVPGATVGFETNGVTFTLSRSSSTPGDPGARFGPTSRTTESLRVRASFPGANPAPIVEGLAPQEHVSSFYRGSDPAAWRTGVRSFGAVRYRQLYPGVDLEYHGNGRALEYDVHVAPGADAGVVRVRYDGVDGLAVTPDGQLEVTTRFGRMVEAAPVAYQVLEDGAHRPVAARYRVIDDHTFGFDVDGVDPALALVIDPVLKYSTYLGGVTYDEVHDIAVDALGNAFVAGGTLSPDFPATGAPVPSTRYSVFVTKIAPNGGSLVYSVFLGGSEDQIAYGLTLDAAGNAYVCGITGSNDFPTTAGAFDVTFNGSNPGEADMFVAKLSPSATLLYSTYFGGSTTEWGGRIVLDAAGRVAFIGNTGSTNLPTTAGAYDVTFNPSGNDVFVAKLNLAGTGAADLVYSTYLGGASDEEVYDITIDNAGDLYVAGSTRSNNFPATGGPPFNSTFDAFVAKLRTAGAGAADLVYATKIGGVGQDYGGGVSVDGIGSAYLTGSTASNNFPTFGAYQAAYGGGTYDGFVAKFSPNGANVQFCTYLGGANEDRCGDSFLDASWQLVVVGYTNSPAFPTTSGAYDVTFNGGYDMFIAEFAYYGGFNYCTLFGGTQDDIPYGLAVDGGGSWYVTGTTMSSDYPTTAGAYDTSINGGPIDVVVARFSPADQESCAACASPPDTCCARAPSFHGIEVPAMSTNVLVGTREPQPGYPYGVTVYDLGSPLPSPLEDTNWASMTRWNGPFGTWNRDTLGTVFGLTVDEYGNIFVTHTSCYSVDGIAKVFGGAPGAIYRIDGTTGAVNTFCVLPNAPDGAVTAGENWPALGNISYDCRHKQFFVTDLEDGKIYRIKPTGVNAPTGTVQQVFDPMTPDNGAPGWAPLTERIWGVQVHGSRVYYGTWNADLLHPSPPGPTEVRSVALTSAGAFQAGTDQHELFLPKFPQHTFSMPISDISFSASGKMLVAERSMQDETYSTAHMSRVFEFACSGGCWRPANLFTVGAISAENSAGGVDYDRDPFTGGPLGRVWATGDALHLGFPYLDAIYGLQGFHPTGGSVLNSMLIDSDGLVSSGDKTYIGDVEAPGCPDTTIGSVCGQKFLDVNHNGVKNGGDVGLGGWTIVLNGPGGPYTVVTDANGNYCFNGLPAGTYTVSEVGQASWLQTAPAGGTHTVVLAGGQTAGGKDFGNYPATPTTGCVLPPPGMVAWWPFRETVGATSAVDVTHQTPAKNGMQLLSGAAVSANGKVGNGVCFPNELQYGRVPNANQAGLNFGAGPFAIDLWLRPLAGSGTRMIVEKRVLISSLPYKTRGWALYLDGMQLKLELGIGIATQIVPGPTLPASAWSHVAVSVARSPAAGVWYVNGSAVTAFNFTPTPGGTQSNADMYVGLTSPPFGSTGSLLGCIDELEIFDTPLTALSVSSVYAAGVNGKCLEYCRVPEVTTICKDHTSVQVCMSICNNTPTTQTYHWSLAGTGGCTTSGPTTFTPPAGAVSVPPNSCTPVCVTIPRPPGLTVSGATSCYAFTFVNDTTGASYTCQGKLQADMSCWCLQPLQQDIVAVPARLAVGQIGIPIDIGVGFPCGGAGTLSYSIVARYAATSDHGDPLEVSLNGLPPGEPVFGDLSVGGPGQPPPGPITVYVKYPRGYDPAGLYEIVLQADTDGDGVAQDVCGTRIASMPDSVLDVTAVPEGPRVADSVKLLATPNPFFGGSMIAFTLAMPTDVRLGVYDVGGRLVRTVSNGRLGAGAHRLEWDGRDGSGHRAPAGVYFVKLESNRLELDTKVVKLR